MNQPAIQRVGILTNVRKLHADEVRRQIVAWLTKRHVTVFDVLVTPLEQALSEAELFICLGGDGTILHLAGKMVDRAVPVLGINLGGLGFLTEVRREELQSELELIFNGHYDIEERMLLDAQVSSAAGTAGSEKKARRFQALNDVVIHREGLTRYMGIQVDIGRACATRFSGDGVVIATPTGSTAYSLSAGGPIMHPSVDCMVITPICAHTSALRPLVVAGNEVIQIRIASGEPVSRALCTADGQIDMEIDSDSIVRVTRARNRFRLVKSSKRNYFETLKAKFKLP